MYIVRPRTHATQKQPVGGRIVLAYGRDAADVAFISDYGGTPLKVGEMKVEVSAFGDAGNAPGTPPTLDSQPVTRTEAPPLWS